MVPIGAVSCRSWRGRRIRVSGLVYFRRPWIGSRRGKVGQVRESGRGSRRVRRGAALHSVRMAPPKIPPTRAEWRVTDTSFGNDLQQAECSDGPMMFARPGVKHQVHLAGVRFVGHAVVQHQHPERAVHVWSAFFTRRRCQIPTGSNRCHSKVPAWCAAGSDESGRVRRASVAVACEGVAITRSVNHTAVTLG
jgi:hypothetical protein